MGCFYGWRNKDTGSFRKSYMVSRGDKPCVFLTSKQAKSQLDKWNSIGKYTEYEVSILCESVE